MRLALYQPDIPQNLGAIIRIAACFKAGLDIIEPCGFPLSDRQIKRVAMDYIDLVPVKRHNSWE
ncbi:MAG: tRNA (cytidine(34)-2'-O)-methyltransferase, partial [Dongiaceae bacterium]